MGLCLSKCGEAHKKAAVVAASLSHHRSPHSLDHDPNLALKKFLHLYDTDRPKKSSSSPRPSLDDSLVIPHSSELFSLAEGHRYHSSRFSASEPETTVSRGQTLTKRITNESSSKRSVSEVTGEDLHEHLVKTMERLERFSDEELPEVIERLEKFPHRETSEKRRSSFHRVNMSHDRLPQSLGLDVLLPEEGLLDACENEVLKEITLENVVTSFLNGLDRAHRSARPREMAAAPSLASASGKECLSNSLEVEAQIREKGHKRSESLRELPMETAAKGLEPSVTCLCQTFASSVVQPIDLSPKNGVNEEMERPGSTETFEEIDENLQFTVFEARFDSVHSIAGDSSTYGAQQDSRSTTGGSNLTVDPPNPAVVAEGPALEAVGDYTESVSEKYIGPSLQQPDQERVDALISHSPSKGKRAKKTEGVARPALKDVNVNIALVQEVSTKKSAVPMRTRKGLRRGMSRSLDSRESPLSQLEFKVFQQVKALSVSRPQKVQVETHISDEEDGKFLGIVEELLQQLEDKEEAAWLVEMKDVQARRSVMRQTEEKVEEDPLHVHWTFQSSKRAVQSSRVLPVESIPASQQQFDDAQLCIHSRTSPETSLPDAEAAVPVHNLTSSDLKASVETTSKISQPGIDSSFVVDEQIISPFDLSLFENNLDQKLAESVIELHLELAETSTSTASQSHSWGSGSEASSIKAIDAGLNEDPIVLNSVAYGSLAEVQQEPHGQQTQTAGKELEGSFTEMDEKTDLSALVSLTPELSTESEMTRETKRLWAPGKEEDASSCAHNVCKVEELHALCTDMEKDSNAPDHGDIRLPSTGINLSRGTLTLPESERFDKVPICFTRTEETAPILRQSPDLFTKVNIEPETSSHNEDCTLLSFIEPQATADTDLLREGEDIEVPFSATTVEGNAVTVQQLCVMSFGVEGEMETSNQHMELLRRAFYESHTQEFSC